jgi:hypothetical protein
VTEGLLYPHQADGVAFLLSKKRTILADDMGLGKTRGPKVLRSGEATPKLGPDPERSARRDAWH